PSPTISTSVSSTWAPGSPGNSSTSSVSPSRTVYCLPPLRITAYIGCGPLFWSRPLMVAKRPAIRQRRIFVHERGEAVTASPLLGRIVGGLAAGPFRRQQLRGGAATPGESGPRLGLRQLPLVGLFAAARRRGRFRQAGRLGRELLVLAEQPRHIVALDRLVLDQLAGHAVQDVPIFGDDAVRDFLGALDQPPNLVVDLLGDLLRVVALLGDLAAEENELLLAAERARAEPLAHTPLRDHVAGDLGRAGDVIRGAGGHVAEDQFLGLVAAERHGELRRVVRLVAQVAILLRQEAGEAAGHAARNDRDLEHRVSFGQLHRHECVARLVVGDDLLLARADHAALALRPGDHAVDR